MIRARLSLLAALLAAAPALQAAASSEISGQVRDAGGRPVAGATVRLSGGGLSRSTQTDAEGRFRFQGVPNGAFELTAVHGGASGSVRTVAGEGNGKADIVVFEAGAKVVVESDLAIATAVDLGKVQVPLKDFPQSAVVVPASVLAETGSMKLEQGLKNVSGVTNNSNSNYGFFDNQLIRGLQVTYFRDGIQDATTFFGYIRSLYDVEQLEVLKGPGSALFGNGGPGGSINLVSKSPRFDPSGAFTLGGGAWGTVSGVVDMTGPIGERTAYRVIADASKTNGWRDLDGKTTEILPALLWRLTEQQTLQLQLQYRKIEQKPDSAGIPFHLSTTASLNDPHLLAVDPKTSYATPFANTVNEIFNVVLSHEWNLSDSLTWRSSASRTKRDLDVDRNFYIPVFTSATAMDGRYLRDQHDSYTDTTLRTMVDWRVKTGFLDHHLQGGLELYKADVSTNRRQAKFAPMPDAYHPTFAEKSLGELEFAFIFDRSIDVSREGLFATDQIALGEQWKLRLSVRRDHYKTTDEGLYNNLGNNSFNATLAANGQSYTVKPLTLLQQTLTTDEWFNNGQAGVVYQPVPQTSFFVGAAWGRYANLTTEDPRTAALPESNRQLELGNRTNLLNGRLALTTALFRTTRFNVPSIGVVNNNPVVTLIPKQEVKGLDLDLSATPLPGCFLLAAASWMDPVYEQAPASDLALQGKQLQGVPKRTARLWTSYQVQDGTLKGFGGGLGLTHRSEILTTNRSTGAVYFIPVDGYTVLDASLFWRRGPWEAQLALKNATDKTYFTHTVINSAVPGEGRNVQASVTYRF